MGKLEQIIKKANKIHNFKYDYSLFDLKRMIDKSSIICPIHGEFQQTMHDHLKGQGCPKCGIERRSQSKTLSEEEVIERIKKKHKGKYDTSKVKYNGSKNKITLICPMHGEFSAKANDIFKGQGCPKCYNERRSEVNRKNPQQFIDEIDSLYNSKYDMSKCNYVNQEVKITAICPIHGNFQITPYKFLHGSHCPHCMKEERDKKRISKMMQSFIDKSNRIHNNKYDYTKVKYVNAFTPVKIICPVHGEYEQVPSYHLSGNGCPKCANEMKESNGEKEVKLFIKSLLDNVSVLYNNRSLLKKYELDVYIPDRQIAIEYDGLYWHSDRNTPNDYHLRKTELCEEKNVRLIHIFEDEWKYKKEIAKSYIKKALQIYDKSINANECNIKAISVKQCNDFLETNHIIGKCSSNVRFGLYYANELVKVMCFKDNQLVRDCDKLNMDIIDGEEKILEYFKENYDYGNIIVKVDRRWNDGSQYEKIGFQKIGFENCKYTYVIHDKRKSKNENDNLYKIYDCGKVILEMKN